MSLVSRVNHEDDITLVVLLGLSASLVNRSDSSRVQDNARSDEEVMLFCVVVDRYSQVSLQDPSPRARAGDFEPRRSSFGRPYTSSKHRVS